MISAGTSVRESVELIRAAGTTPAGVLIALDRQERGLGELSAVQEVQHDYGIPVIAVAGLGGFDGLPQTPPGICRAPCSSRCLSGEVRR